MIPSSTDAVDMGLILFKLFHKYVVGVLDCILHIAALIGYWGFTPISLNLVTQFHPQKGTSEQGCDGIGMAT